MKGLLQTRAGTAEFKRFVERLRGRGRGQNPGVEQRVRKILARVKREGDAALVSLTGQLDGVKLGRGKLGVSREELKAAEKQLDPGLLRTLRRAARRIWEFHKRQVEKSWVYRDSSGMRLGQKIEPLDRVGVYIPGGTAQYPSSVLMNVIPAKVAGVREVVIVSPPRKDGDAVPVYAAASVAGADAFFRVGGAQAIAALAYGTGSIPRVDKICGPGNMYVSAAKQLVFGEVDIDMVAGPSEVLVVADNTAEARLVAADMLAQAEHDAFAAAVLVTTSMRLAVAVRKELQEQLGGLPRRRIAGASLNRYGAMILVRSLKQAADVANLIAPEHLELMVRNPAGLARLVRHAGAIFLGANTPESLGDYVAGPSHVLPTGGTARFSSPLGVYDFLKRSSIVEASRAALERLGPLAAELADMEGLRAHALAVRYRLGKD